VMYAYKDMITIAHGRENVLVQEILKHFIHS